LYRWVAGLAVAETREDRAQFVIQPPLVGGIMHAQASLRTIWGQASVAWKREGLRFRLEVEVPWNCTALVHLPKDAGSHSIGAGRYVFVAELLTEPQPILKK
jgi:alpha-L-rhamnosidase